MSRVSTDLLVKVNWNVVKVISTIVKAAIRTAFTIAISPLPILLVFLVCVLLLLLLRRRRRRRRRRRPSSAHAPDGGGHGQGARCAVGGGHFPNVN